MAKKRTTLAPRITDYTSELVGYDLYGYENMQHRDTFFCYRFPAKHLKQAKRALRNLAYGGFLIEVWTFNYSTERQIAYYPGNPELVNRQRESDSEDPPDWKIFPGEPESSPPNLHIQSGEILPTNPPKYKHFTIEQAPGGTKITPIAEGTIGKDTQLHMASPVKDFIDETQGLTFPTPKAHEGQDYDGH